MPSASKKRVWRSSVSPRSMVAVVGDRSKCSADCSTLITALLLSPSPLYTVRSRSLRISAPFLS